MANVKNGLLLLLIFVLAIIYASVYFSEDIKEIADPSKKYDVSNRPVLRILFIGNSYTFFNDMPKTIELLAEHDPDAPFRVETGMLVEGGATLAHLSGKPEAKTILQQKQWDYVVLQPQSLWATRKAWTYRTSIGLSYWTNAIKKSGAQPVFFMTWPRQPNTNWYSSAQYLFLKSPASMYKRIKGYTKSFSNQYDMLTVPVGDLWVESLNKYPDLYIYSADGTHPSAEGSMLIAMAFYKKLVSHTLEDITYYPEYISPEERNHIIDVVNSMK